jgi:methylenetetrahydrofolate--tRNA-(uracil-5-)-methyltransferase
MPSHVPVTVLGGGLAGVECAWQLARRGHAVRLLEMRPLRTTDAHTTDRLAEMVCSNSFRSDNPANAVGLLKREMEIVGSLVLSEARRAAVPAGDALAVDRTLFAEGVTARIAACSRIELVRAEAETLPDPGEGFVVVATGPLTSPHLAESLRHALGDEYLYFYDAVAPIVDASSIDLSRLFAASRWGKGGGADYLNIPLSRAEYETFVQDLLSAEKVPLHDFEKAAYFEGCLPIEEMAERGIETLRHGPMKPFGLPDPRTGREPYAAVQLRQDDLAKDHFNIVGFQTKLRTGEQKRVFRKLPGLAEAVFVRYGLLHRNTYINGPAHLDRLLAWKKDPRISFAGQITGVEGYLESAATGLLVGVALAGRLEGREPEPIPFSTALGALTRHVSEHSEHDYSPMNVTFGLFDDADIPAIRDKTKRREEICRRALAATGVWWAALGASGGTPEGLAEEPGR